MLRGVRLGLHTSLLHHVYARVRLNGVHLPPAVLQSQGQDLPCSAAAIEPFSKSSRNEESFYGVSREPPFLALGDTPLREVSIQYLSNNVDDDIQVCAERF